MKYSELLMRWLKDLGYTHCFFVAGGNNMHLLDGARQTMVCIPTVHEVAAGIATEFFNEEARASGSAERAFAMVTAGPGLTNILTAVASAFMESRDLLLLGGQVKTSDLATDGVRQRGIQEVDGVAMAAPVCKVAKRLDAPVSRARFVEMVAAGTTGRMGPVFLELPLDVQGAPVDVAALETAPVAPVVGDLAVDHSVLERVRGLLAAAQRPVLLFGGGLTRGAVRAALDRLHELELPTVTTWNGADRIDAGDPVYCGRANTWGQRSANLIVGQADLVLALGTRLGLQQTGFNWQEYAPLAKVVQVEIDEAELRKGHPRVDVPWQADANAVLPQLLADGRLPGWHAWLAECQEIRELIPLVEDNGTRPGYVDAFDFTLALSRLAGPDDILVPSSSGGGYTVAMQVWEQKLGQTIISDKGIASMGYGLGGALGAAFAGGGRRTIHIEGDGGFTQNLQELATVAVNALPIKTFLMSNEGYASIRMTQRNYFGGAYLGCDVRTGLGFPDWDLLFRAYGIPLLTLTDGLQTPGFAELFDAPGPAAFVVPVDPEQSYFPKITSRVTASGGMESNPLHRMSPDLPAELAHKVYRYISAPTPEGER